MLKENFFLENGYSDIIKKAFGDVVWDFSCSIGRRNWKSNTWILAQFWSSLDDRLLSKTRSLWFFNLIRNYKSMGYMSLKTFFISRYFTKTSHAYCSQCLAVFKYIFHSSFDAEMREKIQK
jgi:hypothetical protein